MADAKNDKDKVENPLKKNKRLKKEKIRQKHLLKAEKKARLKAEKANNNKKAGNNKNTENAKDACPFISAVITSSDAPTLVAASLSFSIPIAISSGFSTLSSVNSSTASTIGAFIAIYPSTFFFLVWLSSFSFSTFYTTPIFPFLM